MSVAKVKFFNDHKGFGFLTPDDDGPDIFMHVTKVQGGHVLDRGDVVEYETYESSPGRVAAKNVRLVKRAIWT